MANTTEKLLNWVTPDSFKSDDKQYVGINNFKMFVEISSTVNYEASIPDIVCEDLTTATDSITNTPKEITIVGEVADIYIEKSVSEGFGTFTAKVLNSVSPYLPDRTLSQIQKVEEDLNTINNNIDEISSYSDSALDLIDTALGNTSEGIKDQFFNNIEKWYDNKVLLTVDTLYRTYTNYAITSFSYTETNDGDTGDFTISLKEIRIIDIGLFRGGEEITPAEEAKKNVNKSLGGQTDSEIDKGISAGSPVDVSKSEELIKRLF